MPSYKEGLLEASPWTFNKRHADITSGLSLLGMSLPCFQNCVMELENQKLSISSVKTLYEFINSHVKRHLHLAPWLHCLRPRSVGKDLNLVKIPGCRVYETQVYLYSPGSRQKVTKQRLFSLHTTNAFSSGGQVLSGKERYPFFYWY